MSCFSMNGNGNMPQRAPRGCTNSTTPLQITLNANRQGGDDNEDNEQIDTTTPFGQYKQCVQTCVGTPTNCPTQLNCALSRGRDRRDDHGMGGRGSVSALPLQVLLSAMVDVDESTIFYFPRSLK